MGLFNRKKKEDKAATVEIPTISHEHTWKDMPWYMSISYSEKDNTASYEIIEPYICITCGERKNVNLEHRYWSGVTPEIREKLYQKVRNRYKKYLKPRAIVEDMINNILLVKDPNHLDMVEEMRGTPHRGCGTSSAMRTRNTNTDKFKVGGK
jgi:hypothetical protein